MSPWWQTRDPTATDAGRFAVRIWLLREKNSKAGVQSRLRAWAQRRDRFMTQRHPSRGTGGAGGGGLPQGSVPKDVSVLHQTDHARVQGRQFRA